MGRANGATPRGAPGSGRGRRELLSFAELFAASGLAVAQPLFDVASKNSELFSTRHVSAPGLVAIVLAVIFVPPLVLLGLEVLVGLVVPRARRYVHAVLVGALLGVWGMAVAKHATDLGERVLIGIGILVALAAIALVLRVALVATFLRVLAIAPLLFALLFLFDSQVGTVVFDANAQAATVAVAHPHRVVWVVLDELPLTSLLDGTGHVDAELFPNFAALASASTWYRDTTTVAPYTLDAVPALLTGQMPKRALEPAVLANHPHNAFTLLGREYDMHAHETLTVLCPGGLCRADKGPSAAPQGAADALGGAIRLWADFIGPERETSGPVPGEGLLGLDPNPVATARNFINGLHRSTVPTFDFLHLMLPHTPWHLRQSLQDDGDPADLLGWLENPWASQWATVSGRQRHLLQVQASDTLLGALTRRLRRLGAWDDSLVIVTADHGMGFSVGDSSRGLSTADTPDLVWTPLFVKYPGQTAGTIDDRPARSLDVLPTVADVLGIRIPWAVDGRSLLAPPVADPEVSVLAWPFDTLHPAAGSRFNVVDRAQGFRAVIKRKAAPAAGDPALRIYRAGSYGPLVGRPAAPLIDPGRPQALISVGGDARRFDHVDPGAGHAPWLSMTGTAVTGGKPVALAVAVNGVVAGVSETVPARTGGAAWWVTLAPEMFTRGHNRVEVYQVLGGPTNPRLVLVGNSG